MDVEIITTSVQHEWIRETAKKLFGDMIKCVVDIHEQIIAVGGELHADAEAVLLDRGSQQKNLWGINIYVDQPCESWIEFDSMINIRPSQGNRSRSVEDEAIRKQIVAVVNRLIT